jgi:pimeloyl-ACP methyl ester carboxylesterase
MSMLNGYLQTGHGPCKIVGLSGQFGSATDWNAVASSLDPELFTCIWFDYRGYGASNLRIGDYTVAEAAADVLALTDHFGWSRFGLIGHSMGGMVMQRVLLDAPGRVDRMAAITPVPASGVRMDAARLERFRNSARCVNTRAAVIAGSTGNRLTPTWALGLARQSWATSVPKAFSGYLEQWTSLDFSEEVRGHPVPVKVLVGEHDAGLTPEVMERTWMSWYPNAHMEVIANAGHYPMHETAPALAATLQRFFAPSNTGN